MDPWSFFIWDEFVDPGKPLECPGCGVLLDAACVQWDEDEERYVIVCPDCGTVTECQSRSDTLDRPDC